MRKWNYRVARRASQPVPSFGIYEFYYDKEGNIELYSASPMAPYGDIEEELYYDVEMMMEAFNKPILDLDDVDIMILMNKQLKQNKKIVKKGNAK